MSMAITKNANGNYDLTVDGETVLADKTLGECILAYTNIETEREAEKWRDKNQSKNP